MKYLFKILIKLKTAKFSTDLKNLNLSTAVVSSFDLKSYKNIGLGNILDLGWRVEHWLG